LQNILNRQMMKSDTGDSLILPSISVDCVIFGYTENTLSVLVRREHVPLDNK